MRIRNIADLVDGQEYWHLFVENVCHWQISVRLSKYRNGENWTDMIVYDNETEAKAEAQRLQISINSLIIK
jgi:hypothetical protein